MKSRQSLLLAAAAPLALAAAGLAPAGFLEDFKQALAAKDEARMKELVAANQDQAVSVSVDTCEAILVQSSEELERLIGGLSKAWRQAFETDFVSGQYEYYSLMRPENRAPWQELNQRFDIETGRFQKTMAERAYRDLPSIGYEMEGYARSYSGLGDLYHASEAWLMHAAAFEEQYLGAEANLDTTRVGLEQAIRLRETIGLSDEALRKARERFQELETRRALEGTEDPEGGEAAPTTIGTAATVALTFQQVEDFDGVPRPYYCADEVFQMWPGIGLNKVGSQSTFPYLEGPTTVIRSAHAEALVDQDGDGTGDVPIPLTGTLVAVPFTLPRADQALPWSFLARIGQARDRFQGYDFNLDMDEHQLQIYVAPAASLVGELNGIPIQVFDDNMDGVYGGDVKNWSNIGCLPSGSGQADVDALHVGEEKSARPWSPVSRIGGAWYRLKIDGTTLTALPIPEVATGKLRMDFAGLDPDYLIVLGVTNFGDAYFDLAAAEAKKGLDVPVGTYLLVSGRVSKGKRDQMLKALIVPPETARTFEVTAGQSQTMQLGAPFGFQFEVRQTEESVTVVGKSVAVRGRGGETYQRLWNCVVTPDVSTRKAGTKKGSQAETMRTAMSQEDINEAEGDYEIAWFPWDLELPKKKAGEEQEVQLSMKKHKLFGKIESEWHK